MLLFTLFFACGETIKVTDNSQYCQEDSEANLIAEDADCDGILTADDCDDADAASTIIADDADCDGTPTADDCDDADAASNVVADDADCDGTLTADDCDDTDATSTIIADDADCDGTLTADDCDDADAASTAIADDADCDGTPTAADCDDNNVDSTVVADDADCDGSMTADDCDDSNPLIYPGASDQWYDGIDSDCLGNNDYDQDGDGDIREGDEYCTVLGLLSQADCTSAGGVWSTGYDCNDTNGNRRSLANEDDPTACYKDVDGDGYGDSTLGTNQLAAGLTSGSDCNDTSDTTFPGAGYNETAPVNELCLQDLDGDGYAAPISGECFDFSFSATVPPMGTTTYWPINRDIDVIVDGELFVSQSSSGSVCVEQGRSFAFEYQSSGITNGSNLEASIEWTRGSAHSTLCSLFVNSCTTTFVVDIVNPSSGLYYWVAETNYINGQSSSSSYTTSYPLSNGDELYSGTALGNADIYGTDSDDSDANVQ